MNLRVLARRHPYVVIGCAVILLLGTWELLSALGLISDFLFSRPSSIVKVLLKDLFFPETDTYDQNLRKPLALHILITLRLFAIGFLAAALLGILSGFALGVSRTLYVLCHPVVNALRSIPSAALWPMTLLFLGRNVKSQLFVICFGSFWPILINTMDGVRNIPREVRDGLLFINAEEYKKAIEILLWSLPTILIGLEIGSAIAFLLTITVQYLWESNGGLGWYLLSNQAANNSEGVFAGVLLTCLIGFSLNTGIHKLFDLVSFRESTMTEGIGQRGTRFHKTFRSLDRDLNPSRDRKSVV
jgi:ABC-type nitrate/sulfonate/bicarbonate transport system permease component